MSNTLKVALNWPPEAAVVLVKLPDFKAKKFSGMMELVLSELTKARMRTLGLVEVSSSSKLRMLSLGVMPKIIPIIKVVFFLGGGGRHAKRGGGWGSPPTCPG